MFSFNKKISKIHRIKIKSVYVKNFLISTKVRLKRGEHLHGEEPISSEPTFSEATVRYRDVGRSENLVGK